MINGLSDKGIEFPRSKKDFSKTKFVSIFFVMKTN